MKLKSCELTKSPLNKDMIRISGHVEYDGNFKSETYWYDIPAKYEQYISSSGNPWLACLLPLAVKLGEPLELCRPIDPVLLENMRRLNLVWKTWYTDLHVVPIHADVLTENDQMNSPQSASFFSGGVDAFFTVLHNDQNLNPDRKFVINDLIHVGGLDIPLCNKEAYERIKNKLSSASEKLNKQFVGIATNIRETRLDTAKWGSFYHGGALASIGLMLEKRYQNVLISSSFEFEELFPWGTTPLTDPLFSTKNTRFVHYDSHFGRIEKIKFIAESEVVKNTLHVCFQQESDENCSQCVKCYRTIVILYLLGILDQFPVFKSELFTLTRLAKMHSYHISDIWSLKSIQELAAEKERSDVIQAIEKSFKRTKIVNSIWPLIKALKKKRYLKNLSVKLENVLLKDSIL